MMTGKEVIFGGPEVRERMLKESLDSVALSNGQVNPVAKRALADDWPGEWTKVAPQVADHPPGAELVWAVRGEPFTRPILARSNVGVRIPGFAAKAEKFVYVELMAEGFHGVHAGRYGFFDELEWRGPLMLPNAGVMCGKTKGEADV